MNWVESVSREVAGWGWLVHSFTTFLQHTGLDREFSLDPVLLRASKLATSMATMIPGMIQYFFCIRLVFGWDENNVQNVTANLNILAGLKKLLMTKGSETGAKYIAAGANCRFFT